MGNFALGKGGRFKLEKDALTTARIGLGWTPNEEPNGPDFDLDVSAFCIGENFKIVSDSHFVFYGQVRMGNCVEDAVEKGLFRPVSQDGAVLGAIDDPNGRRSDGEDDEDMLISLNKVDPRVSQIILCVTICKYPDDTKKDKRTLQQHFGMVNDCYIRIVNESTGEQLVRYDLKERFDREDALEFGRLYRQETGWEFEAMGRAQTGSLQALVDIYT